MVARAAIMGVKERFGERAEVEELRETQVGSDKEGESGGLTGG